VGWSSTIRSSIAGHDEDEGDSAGMLYNNGEADQNDTGAADSSMGVAFDDQLLAGIYSESEEEERPPSSSSLPFSPTSTINQQPVMPPSSRLE
jgi:hypothetical protein